MTFISHVKVICHTHTVKEVSSGQVTGAGHIIQITSKSEDVFH